MHINVYKYKETHTNKGLFVHTMLSKNSRSLVILFTFIESFIFINDDGCWLYVFFILAIIIFSMTCLWISLPFLFSIEVKLCNVSRIRTIWYIKYEFPCNIGTGKLNNCLFLTIVIPLHIKYINKKIYLYIQRKNPLKI